MSCLYQTGKQIFFDLFTPLPTDQQISDLSRTDHLDRVVDYLETANGAGEVLRVINFAMEGLKRLPFFSLANREHAKKVADVMSLSGMSLSIPAILTEANVFRKAVSHFYDVSEKLFNLWSTVPVSQHQFIQAGKKAALSGVSLIGTVAQAALFGHESKIFDLGLRQTRVDLLYQGAGLALDIADLIDQLVKRSFPPPTSEKNESTLSWWLVVTKDVSAIGMGVLGILGILFKERYLSKSMNDRVVFALTTIWLPCKIGAHFSK